MSASFTETTVKLQGESTYDAVESGSSHKRTFQIQYTSQPSDLRTVEADLKSHVAPRSDLSGDTLTPKRRSVKYSVKPLGDGLIFAGEIGYEQPDKTEEEENPLERPDTVSFDATSSTEAVFMTEEPVGGDDPKPIVTSAGETFERLPERTTGAFKMVIEGNRATINPALIASYLKPNAVNADAFTVRGIEVGEGEGKMTGCATNLTTEGEYTYWRIMWEVELAEDWQLHIDDRGFCEADPDNDGKLRPIVRGEPPEQVQKSWPLDGSGAAQSNADDSPEELDFNIYPKKDFSVWGWTEEA